MKRKISLFLLSGLSVVTTSCLSATLLSSCTTSLTCTIEINATDANQTGIESKIKTELSRIIFDVQNEKIYGDEGTINSYRIVDPVKFDLETPESDEKITLTIREELVDYENRDSISFVSVAWNDKGLKENETYSKTLKLVTNGHERLKQKNYEVNCTLKLTIKIVKPKS